MKRTSWWNTKILQSLTSIILLGSSVIIALHLLPIPNKSKTLVRYAIHGSTGIPAGIGPIFILDQDLFPNQCGKGTLDINGNLVLTAYANPKCHKGIGILRPHLLPTDLRIPWALVPDDTRLTLRKLSIATLEHAQTVVLRLLRTPFFNRDYAPEIQKILGNAVQQVWNAPAIHQSIQHVTETMNREQSDKILAGLLPIVTEHARRNFWRTVRVSIAALMGSKSQAQQKAIEQLMTEVIADPRVSAHISNTLPPLLASSGTAAIGATIVKEAINILIADVRLQDLILRLFTDRRFLRLKPIGPDAEQLFMILPTSLLRMRHRLDHNPLVSYVLRNLIRRRSSFLVLMLSPEQEKILAKRNLPPEPILNKVGH
ncbi:hypothetical protein TI05_06050 [Achromatium sp. WMS3]|nr:hypothetical protein TI05_06050 [Achromatium sp. WMS3]